MKTWLTLGYNHAGLICSQMLTPIWAIEKICTISAIEKICTISTIELWVDGLLIDLRLMGIFVMQFFNQNTSSQVPGPIGLKGSRLMLMACNINPTWTAKSETLGFIFRAHGSFHIDV